MESTQNSQPKKRWKKALYMTLIISGVILTVATAIFLVLVYKDARDTEKKIVIDVPNAPEVDLSQLKPISILLLGVDERPEAERVGQFANDVGRTDTMVLVTIDPKTSTTKMMSIPRDLRVSLDQVEGYQKINAAYTFGEIEQEGQGPANAMKTVSALFDIPINYFVEMNFQGFSDLVDAVGGINIYNEFEFTTGQFTFPAGDIYLDGEQALAYVRMRHEDPEGEIGRQKRQRKVIEAILAKANGVTVVTRYKEVFDAVGNNMKTNLTFEEMYKLKTAYQPSLASIEDIIMNANPVKIDEPGDSYAGLDYYRMSFEERMRLTQIFRTHMRLEPKDPGQYEMNDEELSDPDIVS